MESDSIEKIMEIDAHVGCAMSGLTADARTMVEHARVTAQVRWSPSISRSNNEEELMIVLSLALDRLAS